MTTCKTQTILLQGATIHTSEGLLVDIIPRQISESAVAQLDSQASRQQYSNGASPEISKVILIPKFQKMPAIGTHTGASVHFSCDHR